MILTINKTSRFKKEYRKAMKRGCDPALFVFVLNEIVNEHPLPENIATTPYREITAVLENAIFSQIGY